MPKKRIQEVRKRDKADRVRPSARRRADHPSVNPYARGRIGNALDIVRNPATKKTAVKKLRDAYFAASTVGPRDTLLKTFIRIAEAADLVPFPLSIEICETVFGAMKEADYRSIPNYISRARQRQLELDLPISSSLALCLKSIERASVRGIGPGKKSAPLSMLLLARGGEDSTLKGGPAEPRHVRTLGITMVWWLLREIEASALTIDKTTVWFDREARTVTLNLPVSKTDTAGKGRRRTHGCICNAGNPLLSANVCPYHVLRRHVRLRCEQAGVVDRDSRKAQRTPLFPSRDNRVFSKRGWVTAINRYVVEWETTEEADLRGQSALTGHCGRSGGAIFLTSCGIPLYAIQLLGRWGSDAVRGYIEDASATWTQSIAPAAVRAQTQPTLLDVNRQGYAPPPAVQVPSGLQDTVNALSRELNTIRSCLTASQLHMTNSSYVVDLRSGLAHRIEPVADPPSTICGMFLSTRYARFKTMTRDPPLEILCTDCRGQSTDSE